MACTNHGARPGTGVDLLQFTFDETAVDFLESLNVPAYKIASFENNHLPLITKAEPQENH